MSEHAQPSPAVPLSPATSSRAQPAVARRPRRRSVLSSRLRRIDDAAQESILVELRRVILSGEVPPGTVIPLAEVAEHFSVSHIPIREALKVLCAERLVDHQPHSGYSVAKLTRHELAELYLVRGALEIAAVDDALRSASAADGDEVGEALAGMDAALAGRDFHGYAEQSRRFHFAVLRPSRKLRLLSMLESVWNLTEPYQPMAQVGHADRASLHAEHRLMLDAFLGRDADRMRELTTRHRQELQRLVSELPLDEVFASSETAPAPDSSGGRFPLLPIPR